MLALWVEGTLLALNGCQDTVTLALAHRGRGPANPHTLRRLQRELLNDDADRIDSWGPGQELEVEGCFAPLLQWVRRWWVPTGRRELAQEPLVLAADPTSKQDELVALVISVVYRQHAVPVAWHIVGAQARESWIVHFCRLLRLLAVPATVPVHVLCDQGLCSRDLRVQIVALGWWGRPRGAEDRGGRGVERAMEECDAGPAPRARVGSGAAGVQPAQARAEVGIGRRSQPRAGSRAPGAALPLPRGACRRPRPARWQSPAPANGGPHAPKATVLDVKSLGRETGLRSRVYGP